MAESYEARFSQKVRHKIHLYGRKTYKMTQKFHRGFPDIYYPRGNWIESKIVSYAGPRSKRPRKPISYFENVQRWTMDHLSQDGDFCMVALLWILDNVTQRFTLMPYTRFRHMQQWNIDEIIHFSDPIENGDIPVPEWIADMNLAPRFDDRFLAWKNRKNTHCYDESQTSDHWYYENGILVGGKNNPINIRKFAKVAVGNDDVDLSTWLAAEDQMLETKNEVELVDGEDDDEDSA